MTSELQTVAAMLGAYVILTHISASAKTDKILWAIENGNFIIIHFVF